MAPVRIRRIRSRTRSETFYEIDRKINQFLREKTLGSLVREYRRNLEKGTIMYYI